MAKGMRRVASTAGVMCLVAAQYVNAAGFQLHELIFENILPESFAIPVFIIIQSVFYFGLGYLFSIVKNKLKKNRV